MNSLKNDVGRFWLEFWGRKRYATRYSFPNDQITAPAIPMHVSWWWNAIYLNLHPTQYAVGIAPNGQAIHLRGGYNFPLPAGHYIFHYVDKQNRVIIIPRVSETTRDGSQVSLELVITYRVIDPIRALEVQQPVETLRVFINSDLKEFIRSHNYDDIVGGSHERGIDSTRVSGYIKDQHASRHQMSRLFFIADVVVDKKIGDPKLTEIRENFQVQQRQNIANGELTKLNQELEKKIASQDAEIKQIKAQSEADQQEITQRMKMQSLEFERARAELQAELHYRQETMTQAMNAIGQALSASAYPLDAHAMEIIQNIIGEFRGQTNPEPIPQMSRKDPKLPEETKTPNVERIGTLTGTLLSWLNNNR